MIAFVHERVDNAHDRLVAMLPHIKQMAQRAFRNQQPESRAELVQETIANAYLAFAKLVQLDDLDPAFATSGDFGTPFRLSEMGWLFEKAEKGLSC